VLARTRFNGQAELVTVRENMVYELPEQLSFEEGAAFPVNYATAQAGLVVMGGLKEGERVLIHAAAGGVGISATQIAKRIGAEVFGTASASKHGAIREQGVDHAIDYRSQDFAGEVRRLTRGDGIDVAFDALGPSSFRKDYQLLRPGGRLIMYGASEVQTGGKAQRTGRAQDPCQEPVLFDALVEGAGGDEREQGRLRPQHALLVGR
jgi:NADPH:quinone reductase-like Zn-dependent oxidoreductase